MSARRIAIVSLMLISAAGCAPSRGNRSEATPPSAIADENGSLTVIGYLEKQDRVITIKSGSKGAVYSVATREGKVLFDNLSAEQLRAQAPELNELIKTGVAGDARTQPFTRTMDSSIR